MKITTMSTGLAMAVLLVGISDVHAGLVAHYKLDDGETNASSLTAVDSAPGPLNGTLTGDATTGGSTDGNGVFDDPKWVTGLDGGAASFGDFFSSSTNFGDKIDDVIEVGSSGVGSKFDIAGALTISAWINLDSNSDNGRKSTRQIAGKDQVGGAGGDSYGLNHSMSGDADTVRFMINSTANVTLASSNTLSNYQAASTNGGWVHVAGVYEPSTSMKLYIDGVLDANITSGVPAAIDSKATPFTIGRLDGSDEHSFYGLIDDVQLYNMALSASQVEYLFDHPGSPVPEPGSLFLGLTAILGLTLTGRKAWREPIS